MILTDISNTNILIQDTVSTQPSTEPSPSQLSQSSNTPIPDIMSIQSSIKPSPYQQTELLNHFGLIPQDKPSTCQPNSSIEPHTTSLNDPPTTSFALPFLVLTPQPVLKRKLEEVDEGGEESETKPKEEMAKL